jgi:uncharacterized protein
MESNLRRLADTASALGLELVYVFGSRALEVHRFLGEDMASLAPGSSDVDIAVLAAGPLDIDRKVAIAAALEDLLGLPRVDVVDLREASPFLALDAVTGELLFAEDAETEARYQLYVMRRAADLLPFQREWEESVLGF